MRFASAYLAFLFCLSFSTRTAGAVEIGATPVGVTLDLPSSGDAQLRLSVPSGTFFGLGSVYVTAFPGGSWMIEPQIMLNYSDSNGSISGMLQFGHLFNPEATSSIYLAVHTGYFHLAGEQRRSAALGAAMGSRKKLLGGLAAVRSELRYRYYLSEDFDLSELAFNIGLGVVFKTE